MAGARVMIKDRTQSTTGLVSLHLCKARYNMVALWITTSANLLDQRNNWHTYLACTSGVNIKVNALKELRAREYHRPIRAKGRIAQNPVQLPELPYACSRVRARLPILDVK